MATYKEQWKASKRLFETTTKLKLDFRAQNQPSPF